MPKDADIRKKAQAYLKHLGDEAKELSAYGDVTVDDLLNEALESTGCQVEADVLNEAVQIRLAQMNLDETPEEARERYMRWQAHEKQAVKRPNRFLALRVAAAAIAGVLVLTISSYGVARAFDWRFIIRILQPFAETFGLSERVSDTAADNLDDLVKQSSEEMAQSLEQDVDAFMEKRYDSLDEMPGIVSGYVGRPSWIPEGYSFSYGISYLDRNRAFLTTVYASGGKEFFVRLSVSLKENFSEDNLFEKDPESGETVVINGHEIVLYSNMDVRGAVWADHDANYLVSGTLTKEEIEKIIRSMYGG